MNVFTLSLWENLRWGLIYFDQFSKLLSIEISHELEAEPSFIREKRTGHLIS